jgi:putative addiction module component (TIGR02574 family)
MSNSAEKLKTELAQLSAQERAELAHFLILSLEGAVDPDAEAAWDAELERREREISVGTAQGEPAEKVLAELRARHS